MPLNGPREATAALIESSLRTRPYPSLGARGPNAASDLLFHEVCMSSRTRDSICIAHPALIRVKAYSDERGLATGENNVALKKGTVPGNLANAMRATESCEDGL